MARLTTALSFLLLIVMIVAAIQNLGSVDVEFLVFSLRMPKILLILLVYFLGMISGWGLLDLVKKAIRNLTSGSASQAK
jgi:uncharacterized integral membrane protein